MVSKGMKINVLHILGVVKLKCKYQQSGFPSYRNFIGKTSAWVTEILLKKF